MSLKTIIRKAHTKGDIKYISEAIGAGRQLTKTWLMRYHNVSGRLVAMTRHLEILYFDRQKTFAEFVWMMQYKPGITIRDRFYFKGRTYLVKLITNWDEQRRYLFLAISEVTDD